MAFSVLAAKAAAAKVTPQVSAIKGPSVVFKGTIEGDELVIRIPLRYAENQIRLSKPNEKTGVQSPYVNGMVRMAAAPPVTVSSANGETAQIYMRPVINLNFLMSYTPRVGVEDGE